MKKLLVLILAFAMVVTLAACAGTTEPSDTVSAESTDTASETEDEPDQEPEEPAVVFDKDIRMIVPWDPGGGTDTAGRALVENAEKYLGVKINVENISGGIGAVGLAEVVNSNPDEFVLGVLHVDLAFMKAQGAYPFDFNDFTQICNINSDPSALTVSADSEFQTIEDLIEYARANPGDVKIGHSGTGLLWHLAAAMLANETGVEFTYVPYDGSSTGQAALMGGEVDAVTYSGAEVSPLVASGDLRVLATFTDERMDLFNGEVPTAIEEGYDVSVMTFRGIGGPVGMDPAVVAALEEGFSQMAQEPSYIEAMNNRGLGLMYLDTAGYEALCEKTGTDMENTLDMLGLLAE